MRNMKRATFALVALILVIGCASTTNRSALETAKLSYADASLLYETTMQTLSDLRAQHRVTDAQWSAIDRAQSVVRTTTPQLRAALTLWESSGTKPVSYDAIAKQISDAIGAVTAISAGVK